MEGNGLKKWEPKKINSRHQHVAALKAAGLRNKEIAELTEYSPSRVSVILGDPRIVALVNQFTSQIVTNVTQDTGEYIKGHTLEAAQSVVALMRGAESEQVQLSASKDLLDRGGFKAKEQIQVTNDYIEGREVSRLVAALEEAATPPPALDFVEDSAGVFRPAGEITSARK
jgi:hypothetical protein